MPRASRYFAACFLLAAAGCAGEARVEGTVTLDQKPLAGAEVVFLADDDKLPPIATSSDADGRYKLIGNQGRGVPPGQYRVVVTRMTLKDNTVPTGEKLDKARNDGTLVNSLPKVYEDRKTTPLTFPLKGGAVTIDLPLKKQP